MTDDLWYVISDALCVLRSTALDTVEDHPHAPWNAYDPDPSDPKTNRETYLALIDEAEREAYKALSCLGE